MLSINRLIRLALAYSNDDPKLAWQYLTEAYQKDPKNPDLRVYRGKMLEAAGKNTLAHKEFLAASSLNPKNLYFQNQLANFYLRQRLYDKALGVWSEHLSPPSNDKFWLEALFWNKMVTPIAFDWKNTPIPEGELDPLVQYFINLGPNRFWDKGAFDKMANNTFALRNLQETFWMRLLNHLQNFEEDEASKLLEYNPFVTNSYYPELETALREF